jgi:hypothetical protein
MQPIEDWLVANTHREATIKINQDRCSIVLFDFRLRKLGNRSGIAGIGRAPTFREAEEIAVRWAVRWDGAV